MERSQKIQRIACIVFFLICLFFPPFPRVFSDQTSDNTNSYSKLVSLYKLYFERQEELFKKLTFKFSADQVVKGGTSFKLTLEDNLGKKWIFKEKGANRVIAQRLYTLFGLNAPEIHKIQLVLNGKLCVGTLQEFIPGLSTLYSYAPASISATGLDYLMKAQVVDWMMRDHDPHSSNFLIISFDKQNRADELMRIDQDCACLDHEVSVLDYERMVAIDKNLNSSAASNFYCRIEEAYQEKKIDLDLKRAYVFVRFIADFPNSQFEEVIWDLKSRGEDSFSKNDPGMLKKKYEFFVNYLVLNKRKMSEDFKKLYSKLAALRGARADFSENLRRSDNLEEYCANLKNKLNTLEKTNSSINSNPGDRPVRISAIASLDGFRVMYRIYYVCWSEKGDLKKECKKALKTLARLGSGAQPNEKKAISLYMQEIRKIQAGKGMTYPFNQINKLVDPIF